MFLRTITTVVLIGCLAAAGSVSAQDVVVEEDAGNAYTDRNLTLDAGTLRVDLAPPDRAFLALAGTFGAPQGFSIGNDDRFADTFVDLRAGAAFGIIDGLEAGALVLPLAFAPDARDTFGDPIIYGRYQFVSGTTQVAGQVSLLIPVQDLSDFGITLAVPVKFQLCGNMHINTGLALPITFGDDTVVGLQIPVEYAINVLPSVFLGVNSGINTQLTPDGFDPVVFPLGFFGGYTLAIHDTASLDLQAGFSWFNFLGAGDSRGDAIDGSSYRITLGAVLYMDVAG